MDSPMITVAFPFLFIVALFLYDVSKRISYPKSLRTTANVLVSPFRDFLLLEDLEETRSGIPQVETPMWKSRAIICCSLTQCFLLSGLSMYYASFSDDITTLASSVNSLAWVSITRFYCRIALTFHSITCQLAYGTIFQLRRHTLLCCISSQTRF